jgi:hypothetical protein
MLELKEAPPDAGIVSEWEQSLENGGEIDSPQPGLPIRPAEAAGLEIRPARRDHERAGKAT